MDTGRKPPRAPATLDEIRSAIADLPPGDEACAAAAAAREARLLKPPGALGRLEEIALWLCRWQGSRRPRADNARIAVFAGSHGVARRGVSAYPPEVTAQMVAGFRAGHAAINQLAGVAGAELKVYEMAVEEPTADMCDGPAMDARGLTDALAYGMTAAEPGLDVLALGEMGIANTTAAAALCHALFGGEAAQWCGPGTGITTAQQAHKASVVAEAVACNRDAMGDPLDALRCVGGRELAGIAGAVLAARHLRVPVVLDGYTCTAAAAVLHAMNHGALDHCLVAHRSTEPGHAWLMAKLGKKPLFDLDMRLGEASGAALALPLLRAAAACHTGMATFEEAGVSPGDD